MLRDRAGESVRNDIKGGVPRGARQRSVRLP